MDINSKQKILQEIILVTIKGEKHGVLKFTDKVKEK